MVIRTIESISSARHDRILDNDMDQRCHDIPEKPINMRQNDLLIIIPAWNEEVTLPGVLEELMSIELIKADVIVVDDGSSDSTADIALSHGANVLRLPENLGVGGAMRAGYLYALREGYHAAIQLDADGQHRPSDIPSLLNELQRTESDLVIGARFAGTGSYTVHGPRAWAMSFLSKILSKVCHTTLTDTTSGFKAANERTIRVFAHELPAEYLGDTIEALVIAAKHGLTVTQVPVEMRERQGGKPSQGTIQAAVFWREPCSLCSLH